MNARRFSLILASAALVLSASIARDLHTVAAPSAPIPPASMICQAERSETLEGVEIIAYPSGTARPLGVVVACPQS